jgi:hypothetical protein
MRSKLVSFFVSLLVFSAIAIAQQSGGDFEITSSTVDNGGGTSVGGEYTLTGTIGQPDANPQVSSGGQFSLAGGFWARIVDLIFKNSFENQQD